MRTTDVNSCGIDRAKHTALFFDREYDDFVKISMCLIPVELVNRRKSTR